ncbi:hypothetical protein AMS68_006639 [Peltaster fructicola]|uniref:Protein YIP n=1 Tax=Peltaster fructicola TaxID=286661 RepID=A0A6H0Y278_9PEZI|nr:hypothetical protein AMS68_006639 [Peltaster fructicola]
MSKADLGHTDLQDDRLQFHNSDFESNTRGAKVAPDQTSFLQPDTRASAGKGGHLWSISFYQQFFDVDTTQILRRCWSALFPRTNFLDVLDGNPDLYGPFWIATTVVVILFLAGTISDKLHQNDNTRFVYDFKLLSGAAGLIYGYTIFVPVGLWAVLKWFGSQSADVLECWSLYGYANIIWIPVALISWSQLSALNYAFVAVGYAMSAIFLFRNLYPVISAIDAKTSRILLIVILVLHAGLAIAIKILVFTYQSPVASPSTPAAPVATEPALATSTPDGEAQLRFF